MHTLQANQGELVQNMDLLPTIVGLLGLNKSTQNQQILSRLSSQSLLEPVPPERTLVMLNTNDIRTWHTEGFGIFLEHDLRFVFSNTQGPRLFDVAEDPEQFNDLWPQIDAPTQARIIQVVESNRHLKRMWEEQQ